MRGAAVQRGVPRGCESRVAPPRPHSLLSPLPRGSDKSGRVRALLKRKKLCAWACARVRAMDVPMNDLPEWVRDTVTFVNARSKTSDAYIESDTGVLLEQVATHAHLFAAPVSYTHLTLPTKA